MNTGYRDLERRLGRIATVLRMVERTFHVGHIGRDEQAIACDRGGGHAHVVFREFVRVKKLEFLSGFEHEGDAVFVHAEYFSVVGPR